MKEILTAPLTTFLIFLALGTGFFALVRQIAAAGKDEPGKQEPYACGEEIEMNNILLTYHTFFRLALLFGILHIVALVITTIPKGIANRAIALIYLSAAAVTMIILFEKEDKID